MHLRWQRGARNAGQVARSRRRHFRRGAGVLYYFPMETPAKTLNLKYGRLGLGVGIGYILLNRFVLSKADDIGFTMWWLVLVLMGGGVVMMFWVWKDIAKNGIRLARMIVPGILASVGLGFFVVLGLVQWCLAKHHGRDELRNWSYLWVAVGVLHIIYSVGLGMLDG